MYKWGKASKIMYDEIHPVLRHLLDNMLKHRDISIVCGARTMAEQERLFLQNRSKTMNSRHIPRDGESLCRAVDIRHYPYKEGRDTREELTLIAGMIYGLAIASGIPIGRNGLRWGGDWNCNFQTADNSFDDLYHFEWNGPYNFEVIECANL